jgi:hypothetical protein
MHEIGTFLIYADGVNFENRDTIDAVAQSFESFSDRCDDLSCNPEDVLGDMYDKIFLKNYLLRAYLQQEFPDILEKAGVKKLSKISSETQKNLEILTNMHRKGVGNNQGTSSLPENPVNPTAGGFVSRKRVANDGPRFPKLYGKIDKFISSDEGIIVDVRKGRGGYKVLANIGDVLCPYVDTLEGVDFGWDKNTAESHLIGFRGFHNISDADFPFNVQWVSQEPYNGITHDKDGNEAAELPRIFGGINPSGEFKTMSYSKYAEHSSIKSAAAEWKLQIERRERNGDDLQYWKTFGVWPITEEPYETHPQKDTHKHLSASHKFFLVHKPIKGEAKHPVTGTPAPNGTTSPKESNNKKKQRKKRAADIPDNNSPQSGGPDIQAIQLLIQQSFKDFQKESRKNFMSLLDSHTEKLEYRQIDFEQKIERMISEFANRQASAPATPRTGNRAATPRTRPTRPSFMSTLPGIRV